MGTHSGAALGGMVLRWTATLVSTAAFIVSASSASAATICVSVTAPTCDANAAGIQAALDSAKASSADDRVVIGAGGFSGPFSYSPGPDAGQLDIVGQGDATVLFNGTAPTASAITVLSLARDGAGHNANVSALSVHVPGNSGALTPGNIGIHAAGLVDHVSVKFDSTDAIGNQPIGILLSTPGAAVRDSDIDLPAMDNAGSGVKISPIGGAGAAPVVADSRITAGLAVWSAGQAASIIRSRLDSFGAAVFACNAPVTVDDSLIRVTGSGSGLLARGDNVCGTSQASIVARQVTIVGSGTSAGQIGAAAAVGIAGQNPIVDLSFSVIRDVQTAFRAQTVDAGTATVRVGTSDYEAARHSESSGGGGAAIFEQPQPNIDADPLFTDELKGDFSLLPASPAIDSSFSPPLAADESPTDLAGKPRITDGNGDGVDARDMGAFESPAVAPPPPPSPPADTTAPDTTAPDTLITTGPKPKVKTKHSHANVTFSFTSTEANTTFECRFDDADFTSCSSPLRERLRSGRHSFEVRAIDAAGNVDLTPATQRVRVVRKHSR
jgi:hypothetical protein